jgi:hypothetical protein
MGAKRAVEGRSQPYDVLLAAYQKKSIGRPNGKEVLAKKKGTFFFLKDSYLVKLTLYYSFYTYYCCKYYYSFR